MNPTSQDSLPLRFRDGAIDRYRHIMQAVSESWPQPISVDPAPLASETFRSRFRDAVKAVKMNREAHSALNLLIDPWAGSYAVSQTAEGKILIGPKELLRVRKAKPLKPGLLISGVATLADAQASIVGPDKDVIQAIALLISYGILSDARISGVTEEFIYSCLPEDYEGGVVANTDETFSIY